MDWLAYADGRLTRVKGRSDVNPGELLAEAAERLQDARGHSQGRQPGEVKLSGALLYALSALADVRVNVDEAIVVLVRQLRLNRPPASWETIGNALGISKQAAHEHYGRKVHQDGYL